MGNNPLNLTDPSGLYARQMGSAAWDLAKSGAHQFGCGYMGNGSVVDYDSNSNTYAAGQATAGFVSAVDTVASAIVFSVAPEALEARAAALELRAAKRGGDFVDGYRAVSKAEAGDIAKHGFRPDPSGRSMQDKWFPESREGAEQFRKTYSDLTEMVHTKVPKNVYDRSFKHPNIDNTGPGFCVQCNDFPLLPKP